MQKIWNRYRDQWWIALLSFVVIYICNKLLDYFFNLIPSYGIQLLSLIKEFVGYKVTFPLFWLVSLVAGILTGVMVNRLRKYWEIKKRSLKIIKASYGNNGHLFNITSELNDAVSNNKLNIVLSNNIAGDPLYGVQKTGFIEYQFNGQISKRNYLEGELINLP